MKAEYVPIEGWFDLSKLKLPQAKLKKYAEIQKLGEQYQKNSAYHKMHNNTQDEKLKQIVAERQFDLISNYNALDFC